MTYIEATYRSAEDKTPTVQVRLNERCQAMLDALTLPPESFGDYLLRGTLTLYRWVQEYHAAAGNAAFERATA